MEFGEKLQELRKNRGLTQEQLAQAIYVSRTAVSKWESGRGYPSIESLKEISAYFSVSIDDLLSGDKLLSLAERENKANLCAVCDLLFGAVDLFSLLLVILPLYPNEAHGYIFSVNLFAYTQVAAWGKAVCWGLIALLFSLGAIKMLATRVRSEKINKLATSLSLVINIFAVIFLALSRQVYAVVIAFLLLVTKGLLLLKRARI